MEKKQPNQSLIYVDEEITFEYDPNQSDEQALLAAKRMDLRQPEQEEARTYQPSPEEVGIADAVQNILRLTSAAQEQVEAVCHHTVLLYPGEVPSLQERQQAVRHLSGMVEEYCDYARSSGMMRQFGPRTRKGQELRSRLNLLKQIAPPMNSESPPRSVVEILSEMPAQKRPSALQTIFFAFNDLKTYCNRFPHRRS